MSMPSLLDTMKKTLEDHRSHSTKPVARKKSKTVYDIPNFRRRHATRRQEGKCVHCHEIFPALRRDALEKKTWEPDDIWVWPSPERIGLFLDPADQTLVRSVVEGSPVAKTEIRPGDRIVSHAGRRLLTIADLQEILDRAPKGKNRLTLRVRRGAEERDAGISLPAGWKVGTPLTFSWRASKWELSPAPGFGGKIVPEEKRAALAIPPGSFGLRVRYLVTWGERAHLGRSAARAGLRKGDIVLSVAGKSDFASQNHFHAWFRLTQKSGDKIPIEILRSGRRSTIELPIRD